MNRVRNREGRGWHARQAHAEQNIGLIEKSALSIHALSMNFLANSHSSHHVRIDIDICLLSADEKGLVLTNVFVCIKLFEISPETTDGEAKYKKMTTNGLFGPLSGHSTLNCIVKECLHLKPECESTSRDD